MLMSFSESFNIQTSYFCCFSLWTTSESCSRTDAFNQKEVGSSPLCWQKDKCILGMTERCQLGKWKSSTKVLKALSAVWTMKKKIWVSNIWTFGMQQQYCIKLILSIKNNPSCTNCNFWMSEWCQLFLKKRESLIRDFGNGGEELRKNASCKNNWD